MSDEDDDIQPVDREAFHALVDADDRQCNNAFRLLARVEHRTKDLLGLEKDLGVQAELRAAVAVAIHEILIEIEGGISAYGWTCHGGGCTRRMD